MESFVLELLSCYYMSDQVSFRIQSTIYTNYKFSEMNVIYLNLYFFSEYKQVFLILLMKTLKTSNLKHIENKVVEIII